MDDARAGGSEIVDGDFQNDNLARKLAEDDIQHAVILPDKVIHSAVGARFIFGANRPA